MSCLVFTSTPIVGSSSSSSSGLRMRARAMNARCCWPPERLRMCRRASLPMPSFVRICRASVRSSDDDQGRSPASAARPRRTTSSTVTGKFQSIASSCGTTPRRIVRACPSSPNRIVPVVGRRLAAISFRSVVLPAPLGPTTPTNAPSGIRRVTSSSTIPSP